MLREQYSRGSSYDVLERLLPERSRTSIARKVERLNIQRNPALMLENSRVGYFDIETNGLKGNFHMILSWFIKERGVEKYHAYTLSKKDFAHSDKTKVDERCTQMLVHTLSQFDYIVTYYGTGFDLPFLRSRALFHNIPFPPYGSVKHIDVYYIVREKMSLHRKSLAAATEFLGIVGKTPLSGTTWVAANLGDEKALSYVREHNKQDVIILEKLHDRLLPFIKGTRRSI